MTNPRIRAVFLFFLVLSFGVLIFGGLIINKAKPPIPLKIVNPSGEKILTEEELLQGQNL